MLVIDMYSRGKLIGTFDYIKLNSFSYENAREIFLYRKGGSVETETIYSGSKIELRIFLCDKQEELRSTDIIDLELIPISDIEFSNSDKVKIYGHLYSKMWSQVYNQYLIDILNEWGKGKEIDIFSQNIDMKDSYLRACILYSEFKQERLEGEKLIRIDGNLISDWYDLYIYLGEELFSKRGFFAFGLDSLNDELIDIQGVAKINLNIYNYDMLVKAVGNYEMKNIFELFEKYDHKIFVIS